MYDALVYKGYLYLPTRSVCTLILLGQILKGRKRVLRIFETCPIEIQSRFKKILTIDRVLLKIGTDKFALSYLRDDPAKHVSLCCLYTILNTLDANFLAYAIDEIH